jgi:predicted RNA-binding Zn ribbon-like protein
MVMDSPGQEAGRSGARRPGSQQRVGRQPVIGPAPGRLEQVRAFVNTLDVEAGTDELSSPAALAAWLTARGLIGSMADAATRDDLRLAVAAREALREILLAHARQEGASGQAVTDLRSVGSGLAARFEIGEDGTVRSVPDGQGPAAGLGALLLIAAEAAVLGTWPRLKVCSADDCRWAFYDRSPTKSGCWCSMAGCGSRAKSRAFRQRAAARR